MSKIDPNVFKELKGIPTHWGAEAQKRSQLLTRIAAIFDAAGVARIETPILDPKAVFTHAVGEQSDIVQKEMFRVYGVKDDTDWVLRPEGTAQVMRSRVLAGQAFPSEKVWYAGPMFRYERPQKGRLRQFTQVGLELFANESVSADIEILLLGQAILDQLPAGSVRLEIGSLGSAECRTRFRAALVEFLDGLGDQICEDCQRRKSENPLRALDCKNKQCQSLYEQAPSMQQYLSDAMRKRQELTLAALDAHGIEYVLNPRLVRGLDYYGGLVFEWTTDLLGAKAAVCAGGRYDALSTMYGAREPIAAVGFALGVERMTELWQHEESHTEDLRIVLQDAELWPEKVWSAVQILRQEGVRVGWAGDARSMKAKMRAANKDAVKHVAVVGASEIEQGTMTIKHLESGEAVEVKIDAESLCAWFQEKGAAV